MLATSHALIAAVIITKIPDPRVSLPLILASHFILDLIPHWDVVTNRERRNNSLTLAGEKNRSKFAFGALIDILSGIGLTLWLFQRIDPLYLFFVIILAQFPDWLEMPYYFWGISFPPSVWAKKFQRKFHTRMKLPWGLVTQIVLLFPLLWWTLH